MPRGQNSSGHWNFHTNYIYCPMCKKKGLHRSSNNGHFYCKYKCPQVLDNWGKDWELIKSVNPQLK
jgi:endogenous inhibitor of DNA gyrase (YacG/DUF329 family)